MNDFWSNVNIAADVDSTVALIMAAIFTIGVIVMYLPSVKVNGLRPVTAWMLSTAALLFLSSSAWLAVDDVLISPYTASFIWVRVVCRVLNLIATLAFIYRICHESKAG